MIISDGDRRHVLRQPHDPSAATYIFAVVSRTPPTACQTGANPLFYSPCWMVVEYCAGR